MECDICGQAFENSEQLQKHTERMHPADEGDKSMDKSMDKLEKPDLLGDTTDESSAREVPKPTH